MYTLLLSIISVSVQEAWGRMKEELELFRFFCSFEENIHIHKRAMILNLLKTHPTCFDTLKRSPLQFLGKSSQGLL